MKFSDDGKIKNFLTVETQFVTIKKNDYLLEIIFH